MITFKTAYGCLHKNKIKIVSDYGYDKSNHVVTMPQPQFISRLASTLKIEDRA